MDSQKEIIGKLLVKGLELDKYKKIIDSKKSISTEKDIQKTYTGFYKVRRNKMWLEEYFNMFEDCENVNFELILRKIYNNEKMKRNDNKKSSLIVLKHLLQAKCLQLLIIINLFLMKIF